MSENIKSKGTTTCYLKARSKYPALVLHLELSDHDKLLTHISAPNTPVFTPNTCMASHNNILNQHIIGMPLVYNLSLPMIAVESLTCKNICFSCICPVTLK